MRGIALLGAVAFIATAWTGALAQPFSEGDIKAKVAQVEARVIAWRRDIHQNPELGNREFRTAKLVADHLRALGLDEVRTGVAHTGVVGVLRGGKPGPVVALRADMDALPVTEPVGLPFRSTVTTTYNGVDVGVMHACGHDAHTAILMGAAEVLTGMRDQLAGTVLFLFQPAEEGPPRGEEGGARLMLKEGAFANPKPDAVFGLHTWPAPPGLISLKSGASMAGSDRLYISVYGRQTHGAMPSRGIDPITVAAQIILGLQTLVTRQMDASASPAVISIGKVTGGVRHNIIPDQVDLVGTIRHLDPASHEKLLAGIRETAMGIAKVSGATADVRIETYAPPVFNDHALAEQMAPTLKRVAGDAGLLRNAPATMGAEDFAYFQREVPGLYFHLGINRQGVPLGAAAPNHSPNFFINEDALKIGVEAMVSLTLDYMAAQ
ncbi:MAG: amidohydrolase [Alphaproteobacteria bacterium]